jgi:rare lipoprotein A
LLIAESAAAQGDTPTGAASRHGTQIGIASVYSKKFAGKKTASGKIFKPNKLSAASRKLPLNSKAKVTNLKTGQSTAVTITDRGPYKKHRVIDLSPAAADRIGLHKQEGVAPVEVKPLAPTAPDTPEAVAETPKP